jgi:hypothetical protein
MHLKLQYSRKVYDTTKIIFLSILFVVLNGCYQDIIDLNLDDLEPAIVIVGNVTDQPGRYVVRVSQAGLYSRKRDPEPVSDAELTITDDTGNTETLYRLTDGVYQSRSLQGGVPGRTYTLKVTVDSEVYTGTSTMPEPLELDSIQVISTGNGGYLHYYFTDREGVDDFCRLKVYINDVFRDEYLYQGRFTDGEQIVLDDELDDWFDLNDQVRIEFYTIDEATYIYLSMLKDLVGEGGDFDPQMPEFIPVTPANPTSNLSNGALGYFSASTMRVYYPVQ